MSKLIAVKFEEGKRAYGKRRLQACLKTEGENVSLERISRLMKAGGLIAANKAHLKRRHALPAAETTASLDLVKRDFNPSGPNRTWVTDISYIPTRESILYLAVVIDLYSRRVVGWHTSQTQNSDLVVTALQNAIARRPDAKNVILHSDRGSQYRSAAYVRFIEKNRFRQSMGGARTCYDNAACETFFGSFKNEDLYRREKSSYDITNCNIFKYIEEFYNPKRLHSRLGYLSPLEYEKLQRLVV